MIIIITIIIPIKYTVVSGIVITHGRMACHWLIVGFLLICSIKLLVTQNEEVINAYVINLKSETSNYDKVSGLIRNVKHSKLNPIRYDAIYGKDFVLKLNKYSDPLIYDYYSQFVTSLCIKFCSYGAIGIGISHLSLSKYIYLNDKNKYAIILEDDIIYIDPLINITNIVLNAPNNWDIIMLHCMFDCRYNNVNDYNLGWQFGSATAYIIKNNKYMIKNKLLNNPLYFHTDDQRCYNLQYIDKYIFGKYNNGLLNIYKSPKKKSN